MVVFLVLAVVVVVVGLVVLQGLLFLVVVEIREVVVGRGQSVQLYPRQAALHKQAYPLLPKRRHVPSFSHGFGSHGDPFFLFQYNYF